ncbi:hypothetical protein OF83DRAFT_362295 [Amylostereum chailletii]|nr:hypothetical protein OF83DRAFT_362295 [Amylostereum chailletii]
MMVWYAGLILGWTTRNMCCHTPPSRDRNDYQGRHRARIRILSHQFNNLPTGPTRTRQARGWQSTILRNPKQPISNTGKPLA